MATFDISIGADLSELLDQLGKIDGVTDKEARKMVRGLKKQFRSATNEARKLNKAMKTNVGEQAKDSFNALKEAAEGMGGSLGGAFGMMDKFGKSAGAATAALGPVGLSAATAALALAGVGFAAFKATDALVGAVRAADRWIEDLDRIGMSAAPAAEASIVELNDALDALVVVGKRVGVQLASGVTEGMEPWVRHAAAMLLVTEDLLLSLGAIEDGGGLTGMLLGGMNEAAMRLFAVGTLEAGEAGAKMTSRLDELFAKMAAVREEEDKGKGSADRYAAAKRAQAEATRDLIAQVKEEAATHRALQTITIDASADMLTASDEIEAAYQRRVDAIAALVFASADLEDVQAAMAAAEARRQRDLTALALTESQARADAWLAGVMAEVDASKGQDDDEEKIHKERMARIKTLQSAALMSIESTRDAWAGFNAMKLDALEAEADGIKQQIKNRADLTDAERKQLKRLLSEKRAAALKTFRQTQQLERAAALMEAASAYMALLRSFAYLSAGAPFAAAAVVGPSLALQLAQIDAQKPPSFPTGGMVGDRIDGDHFAIGAQRDEAILTPRGVSTVGGPAGVDAMNAGMVRATQITIELDGRILGAAMADPGVARATARAIAPSLAALGFRRR